MGRARELPWPPTADELDPSRGRVSLFTDRACRLLHVHPAHVAGKYESKRFESNEVLVHATDTRHTETDVRTPKFIVAAAAASLLAIPAAASADGHGAMVSVVHGIEDTPVDIYANGEPVDGLQGFEFGSYAGPLMLPAGDYEIDVFPAGTSDTPVLEFDGPLNDGDNVTLVAHPTGDDGIALTPFANDVSPSEAGARATVVHAANAPTVSILAGGDPVIEDLSLGDSGSVEVPGGTYDIDIASGGEVVLEVGDTDFAAGQNTTIYAVGTFPDTFELVPATFQLEAADASNPGEAGLSTDNSALALTAAGLMVLAGMALGLRRRAADTV